MSQRGTATHPGSRPSSTSPARLIEPSPGQPGTLPTVVHGRPELADQQRDGRGGGSERAPTRALDVHNILNPPDQSVFGMADSSPYPYQEREASARPYGASQPFFAGHTRPGSHPGTPLESMVRFARRQSPGFSYSLRPLDDSRQPRSPRLAPPSHVMVQGFHREGSILPQSLPSTSSPPRLAHEREYLRQMAAIHHSPRPLASHALADTPPRSLTHLATHHTEAPFMPASGSAHPGRSQSLHLSRSQPGATLSRSLSAAIRGPGDAPSGWSDVMRQSVIGASLPGSEGQQAFMTLPGSDTPIPVQVDYSQASQKANEKRKRNASASTRHRKKKKTMQEENMRQLQELKEERQQVVKKMDELKLQRDFYRDDRNRLREIVARTASIHQHATSPPSPLTTAMEPWAERSPEGTQTSEATPTQGYASDVAPEEQGQARGANDRPELSASAFGPAGRAASGQTMGGPPRPLSSASSASGDRLPPLRAIEGPSPGQNASMRPNQESGQWRPAQPPNFEMGWATGPRRSFDGGNQSQWK
ncbi:hypothetical protein CDD81_1341 [Ophiocordyceps australis]|uniref:BZIP domain-containing protein n=1 Tax=Ophiocordyceps australis TaxID=1399860 RepID=A0A2C5X846_9HYPO|nr:hypothetical protein CDD81_1341 [Ophiocordyceps australis]